jgi:hypothetical protein
MSETRTPEQIREYNRNLLQGEGLAILAMDFFEFSPAVGKIIYAMDTGVAPNAQDIVSLCKVIGEGKRRYDKIMPVRGGGAEHDFGEGYYQ